MKLFKPLPVFLVSILLAACGPMEQEGEEAQMAELAAAEITTESSAEDKVTSAMSAASNVVSEGATVLDWPAAEGEDPGYSERAITVGLVSQTDSLRLALIRCASTLLRWPG